MDGRQIEAIVIISLFFPVLFFFLSLSFYPLLSFSEAARVGSFFSLLLFCPPSYPLIFLLHIIWFPSRSTCHSRWITAVLVWKLWVAHTLTDRRHHRPPPAAPLCLDMCSNISEHQITMFELCLLWKFTLALLLFCFFCLFFSPPSLFSCPGGSRRDSITQPLSTQTLGRPLRCPDTE